MTITFGRAARRTLCIAAFFLGLLSAALPAAAQADPASQLDFVPDASPVSFGAVTVNQPSVRMFTVKNISSVPANLNGLTFSGPDAGQFQPEGGFCGSTLGPSASCSFNIRFTPASPGSFGAQLEVHYDGVNEPLTRQLSGDGVAPDLTLTPGSVDFGITSVEERDGTAPLEVQNAGGAPVQITALAIDGPDSSAFRIDGNTCQPQPLAAGQVCPLVIRFEPQERRAYNATLHVRAGGADFTTTLTGVGGVEDAVMSPSPLDFGNVPVGTSATATITTRSTGNLPFQSVVAMLAGGDVGDLRIVKDMCSLQLLLPTQTCALTVRFTPTTVGPVQAAVAVVGDTQPHLARIRGLGVAPAPRPARPRERGVRVAFAKRGVAEVRRGRVRLGRARCKGAPACSAKVATRFAVRLGGRTYLARGRVHRWTLAPAGRVSVPLARGVRGELSRVILTLHTRAPGHRTTVQRRVLRLVFPRR